MDTAAEAELVAAFLCRGCGAIAVDDARVQTVVAMQPEHRSLENGCVALRTMYDDGVASTAAEQFYSLVM
ncbi:hypothetical protein [Paraburkholderia youngii]|uniref:Uncharacterized protein n=1 Tax=Paraburkholderia youngii TaxID=2782701 RepID=A0A7Y6K7Y7_9BURK|nr:hypothetical protein [Paraburkholderia youngii]NUY06082.1 hypothetical protein [Paraburkholderia youngii]